MKRIKNKRKENETRTLEAKKGSLAMVISLLPNGDIMVQDYSSQNSREKLRQCLRKMGIKTETTLESLCG